jgi:hypothetical protein
MKQAMELKILCWREELAGLSKMQLDFKEEFEFWTEWMFTAKQNSSIVN